MDKYNWVILSELQRNSRVSLKELANRVQLSSPAVSERIEKLKDKGIIDRFSIRLNMSLLGYDLGVYISIKVRFGMAEEFREYIATVPEVMECHVLTGKDCMLMKAYVRNTKHLEELNLRLGRYGELTTSLILSSIIDHKVVEGVF